MPLGTESVAVEMAGCQAGDATFAVAHAVAANPAQAESWMRAWRAATRAQLAQAAVAEAPATLPRAAVSPMPMRLDAAGDGGPAMREPSRRPTCSGSRSSAATRWRSTRRRCSVGRARPRPRPPSSKACACHERRAHVRAAGSRLFLAFAFAYFFSALLRAITATLSPTLTREFELQRARPGPAGRRLLPRLRGASSCRWAPGWTATGPRR